MKKLEDKIFRWVSEKWGGACPPPLNNRSKKVIDPFGGEKVAMILNDGFEIGFGYPDQWSMIWRREVFHKFLWWYLRLWIFSEWWGLRRIIYYKLLSRRVARAQEEVRLFKDAGMEDQIWREHGFKNPGGVLKSDEQKESVKK